MTLYPHHCNAVIDSEQPVAVGGCTAPSAARLLAATAINFLSLEQAFVADIYSATLHTGGQDKTGG